MECHIGGKYCEGQVCWLSAFADERARRKGCLLSGTEERMRLLWIMMVESLMSALLILFFMLSLIGFDCFILNALLS